MGRGGVRVTFRKKSSAREAPGKEERLSLTRPLVSCPEFLFMAAGFDAEVAATRVRVVVESTDGTSGWLSVGTALRAAAVSDAKSVFAAVAVPGAVLGLAGHWVRRTSA